MFPTDAIIEISYFINNEEPKLFIEGSRKNILNDKISFMKVTKTTSLQDAQVGWFKGKFLLSSVIPPFRLTGDPPAEDEIEVVFTGKDFSKYFIGLKIEAVTIVPGKEDDLLNFVPASETSPSPWLENKLPSDRITDENRNLIVKVNKEDKAYTIYTDWMLSTTLALGFEYKVHMSMSGIVINMDTSILDYSPEKSEPTVLTTDSYIDMGEDQTSTIKSEEVTGTDSHLRRIRIVIRVEKDNDAPEQKTPLEITIKDFSFGDPCNPNPCNHPGLSEGNTCKSIKAKQPKCRCIKTRTGDRCERENFCETTKVNDWTGKKFCEQKGLKCVSHKSRHPCKNFLSFECVCKDEKYWDPLMKDCVTFGKCATVESCPENQVCVEKDFNPEKPCSACRDGFQWDEKKENCSPIDHCKKTCGNMLCTEVKGFDEDNNREKIQGICYCPRGFSADLTRKTCIPEAPLKSKRCPEIFRLSAGCEQTCEITFPEEPPNSLTMTCTCVRGYKLNDDGKTCRPDEDWKVETACSPSCPEEQLCVQTGTQTGRCQCKPGYRAKRVGGNRLECLKEKACTEKTDVQTFCGKGIACTSADNKVKCECPAEYQHRDISVGIVSSPFGCVHIKPSDRCEQTKSKEKDGKKCTHQRDATGVSTIWKCPPSHQFDPEKKSCQLQCDIMLNTLKCVKDNRICKNNPLKDTPDCVCPPGFIDTGNDCQLPTSVVDTTSLQVKLPVERKVEASLSYKMFNEDKYDVKFCEQDLDPAGCAEKMMIGITFLAKNPSIKEFLERKQLQEKISTGFNTVFSTELENYLETIVTDAGKLNHKTGIVSGVKLAFLLNSAQADSFCPSENIMQKFREKCLERPFAESKLCALPGGIAFKTASLKKAKTQEIDPCHSDFKYCPPASTCQLVPPPVVKELESKKIKGFPFQCTCLSGYKVDMVHFMQVSTNIKDGTLDIPRREVCVDVDECSLPADHKWRSRKPCPEEATCVDERGGFKCMCPKGWRYDMTGNVCTDVCEGIVCKNGGKCQNHTEFEGLHECNCAHGWRGPVCEEQDQESKTWKSTVIIVSSVLSVLLVIIIVVGIVVHRR